MKGPRRVAAALATALGLLFLPNSQPAPTVFSLVEVQESTGVDFGSDDVVVVLALGSDSRTDDMMEGNADAIELIALNFETGQAAAVGIPRDTVVEFDGDAAKINSGLLRGGPGLMATKVEELTKVEPQYVLTTGFAGFQGLVDTVGQLSVRSDFPVTDPVYDLNVTPGLNKMNGLQATGFARTRELPGNDFDRMANQQHLLQAILDKLRAQEDTEGFIETGALAALQHLDTELSPLELYRFAQAISQIDPAQTTTCVLTGPPKPVGVNIGVDLDPAYAAMVAADAEDGHLEPGTCRG
jgi:LCP family protein required for cell wall assembly